MPIYLKKGQHEEALRDILQLLEPGPCESHDLCEGCRYEWKEAILTAKAALGLPVPRHQCKHCGALDQIWSERVDPDVPGPMTPFYCHVCGKEEEGASEWVEVPVE